MSYFVQSLDAVRTARQMPWLKRGMRVVVDGKPGRITGANSSLNLSVVFDAEPGRRSANCHPKWETCYFDETGKIIADYRQKNGVII